MQLFIIFNRNWSNAPRIRGAIDIKVINKGVAWVEISMDSAR
jgi:hypothetical protein